jgi:hypothetical protein
MLDQPLPVLDHQKFLCRSFDVARRARTHGNHPFGAVLVSPAGEVQAEVENGFVPERDMTVMPNGFSPPKCGRLGATIQHAGWGGAGVGFLRFRCTDWSRPPTEAAYFSPASTLAMRALKRAISSAFSFAV